MNYGYYPDEYYYEDDMGGMEGGQRRTDGAEHHPAPRRRLDGELALPATARSVADFDVRHDGGRERQRRGLSLQPLCRPQDDLLCHATARTFILIEPSGMGHCQSDSW